MRFSKILEGFRKGTKMQTLHKALEKLNINKDEISYTTITVSDNGSYLNIGLFGYDLRIPYVNDEHKLAEFVIDDLINKVRSKIEHHEISIVCLEEFMKGWLIWKVKLGDQELLQ